MNILITGGSGFIGSHLVEYFLDNSLHNVIACSTSDLPKNLLHIIQHERLIIYKIDFLKEPYKISEIFIEHNIDIVYHLYWGSLPRSDRSTYLKDMTESIKPSIYLLNACVDYNISKFIFASSGGAVYGVPEYLPVDEQHPTKPINSYGLSKLMFEKYLSLYEHNYGLNYSILRIANAYGPRQNLKVKQGVISHWLNEIISGNPITVYGSFEVERDYIYIDDTIKILSQFLNSKLKVVNLGSGIPVSLNQILECIKKITNQEIEVVHLNENFKSDVKSISFVPKITLLKEFVTLEDGILNTYNYLKTIK